MPRKKHVCPNGCGDDFYTAAHVMQEWKVDSYGTFIALKEPCLQVTYPPHDDNIWECAKCGAKALKVEVANGGDIHA